jgi:hypothetical protein
MFRVNFQSEDIKEEAQKLESLVMCVTESYAAKALVHAWLILPREN